MPDEQAVEKQRRAAQKSNPLGPGTAGYTTSGAAYRGVEVAAATGAPTPADPGFPVTAVGLHPGQGQRVEGSTEGSGGRTGAAGRTPG